MDKDSEGYKQCIKLAIENAKTRMALLDSLDKKSVLEEYKEWINDSVSYQSILLLREDPII